MKSTSAEFKDEDVQGMTPLPVVPLIDCFVLILVFFLTSTTLTKPHKEVEIDLPHSAAAVKTVAKRETLVIEVSRDGQIYIDSEPMSTTLLHKRLRQASAKSADRRVRIEADRAASFYHIVYLLDLLQFEGLGNVGVRTRD